MKKIVQHTLHLGNFSVFIAFCSLQKLLDNDKTDLPSPRCNACTLPVKDREILLLLPQSALKTKRCCGSQTIPAITHKSVLPSSCSDPVLLKRATCSDPQEAYDDWRGNSDDVELYHSKCLKCAQCSELLNPIDRRCWKYKNCAFVCLHCRIRFTHCARCRLKVASDAWVHKFDKLPFHIACLCCDKCGRKLQQGDKCGIWEDRLYCLEHYLAYVIVYGCKDDALTTQAGSQWQRFPSDQRLSDKHMNGSEPERPKKETPCKDVGIAVGELSDVSSSTSCFVREQSEKTDMVANHTADNGSTVTGLRPATTERDCFTVPSKYPKSTAVPLNMTLPHNNSKSNDLSSDLWYPVDDVTMCDESNGTTADTTIPLVDCVLPIPDPGGHSVDSSTSSGCSTSSKSKRIRTSFTPDQLSILQANFDIESNPDGQELERIANLARLNKRVTQVWFQNARARKKKFECKSVGPSQTFSLTGTPYFLQENNSNSGELYDGVDDNMNNSMHFCNTPTGQYFDGSTPFKNIDSVPGLIDFNSPHTRTPFLQSAALLGGLSRLEFEQFQSSFIVPLNASFTCDRLNSLPDCLKSLPQKSHETNPIKLELLGKNF
ncbi:LIM/homeobox protein Awh [Paragonimus heterotremus]|uniref:LIM/homeobox protein Awh n=1 Tax=Paragonimus heterotremus TaxID=100268 RepID=A0A8J4TPY2_9TREM|nr:LIM/homeobox protein Awh [Paragonimus heterotremus]